ncbi:MAG TPA: T9SS type A sorting domain-containing protein, partial [Bacteroidia bacterium]|nr:T9SS type A sorting domain-containing protein [Bacteroidia bacterium]
LPSVPSAPVSVEVTNELGQVVDAFTMTSNTKEVNLGTKEGGVYFVRITQGATVTVHRVVKQ